MQRPAPEDSIVHSQQTPCVGAPVRPAPVAVSDAADRRWAINHPESLTVQYFTYHSIEGAPTAPAAQKNRDPGPPGRDHAIPPGFENSCGRTVP